MLLGDLGDPVELPFGKDPPGGVLGVAEQEDCRLLRLGLQVVEIDLVAAVFEDQLVVQQLAVVLFDRGEEGEVDRGLEDHPVALFAEGLNGEVEPCDNAGGEGVPLFLRLPQVPSGEPPRHRMIKPFTRFRIPQDRMLQPLAQGLQNKIGRREIHIRHPHGQHIRRPHIFFDEIVLLAEGPPAVDHSVKRTAHCFSQTVNSLKLCWNFRLVSRMTNSMGSGPSMRLKCPPRSRSRPSSV